MSSPLYFDEKFNCIKLGWHLMLKVSRSAAKIKRTVTAVHCELNAKKVIEKFLVDLHDINSMILERFNSQYW